MSDKPAAAPFTIPPGGVCPFRSPMFDPGEPSSVVGLDGKPTGGQVRGAIGPCLGAACGIYVPTAQDDQGVIVQGICGYKLGAIALDRLCGSLDQLVQHVSAGGGRSVFGSFRPVEKDH